MEKKEKKRLAVVKIPISHLDSNPGDSGDKGKNQDLSHTCPASFSCQCTNNQLGASFTCPPNC